MQKQYFKDWADFERYLEKLGFFRMELGLERIGTILDKLGLRRLPCPTAQIVGTNGKGSTCSFLASLARAHGFKAALFSSPHFVSVRERLRIFQPNGSLWGDLLPEERWLEAAEALMQSGGETLTYFELVTALCAWLVKAENANLAVLESGLGGTWDATTALDSDFTVFTPIDLDHCEVLGNSLEEIAGDKAGAMRLNSWAVSVRQTPEAQKVLLERASKLNTRLEFPENQKAQGTVIPKELPEKFSSGMALGIKGAHQTENAALALKAWRHAALLLQIASQPLLEEKGLGEARIPGRMQFIQPAEKPSPAGGPPHPPLIVDGGHNAHGLAALGHSLASLQIAPAVIIFNCMRDKHPEKLIPHLRALSTGQILVPEIKDNPRAMPAAELAKMIGLAATPVSDLAEAIRQASLSINERLPEERGQNTYECKHPLLICGSLYLLGDFFALYPEYLTKDSI